MNWKRAAIIAADIAVGVYLVLAVTAFNKPDDQSLVCTEVPIMIEQDATDGFLTADKVVAILQKADAYPQGRPMQQVSARQIEELLQANELVEKAEVFKTCDGRVCINIVQRIPVVRVMADNGDDYCVDSQGRSVAQSTYTCDLLVATGAITRPYAEQKLSVVARQIIGDKFWRNQAVQLHVLADGSVELVPRVGEHIVYLGQPVGVKKKLERVRKFYKYGLSQAGWNKYSRVSVEFDNQIICKRRKQSKRL